MQIPLHSNPTIYSLRAGAGRRSYGPMWNCEFTINESLESILEDPEASAKGNRIFLYIWNWKLIQEILTELQRSCQMQSGWSGPGDFLLIPGFKRIPSGYRDYGGEGEVTFPGVLGQYVQEAEAPDSRTGEPDGIERRAADRAGTVQERTLQNLWADLGLCLPRLPRHPGDLWIWPHFTFSHEDMGLFTNHVIYYEPARCLTVQLCLSLIDRVRLH